MGLASGRYLGNLVSTEQEIRKKLFNWKRRSRIPLLHTWPFEDVNYFVHEEPIQMFQIFIQSLYKSAFKNSTFIL